MTSHRLVKTAFYLLVLSLFVDGNIQDELRAEGDTAAVSFRLNSQDCIAIVGNGLADRMQHHGWLETTIHSLHPEDEVVIRNLGFTGDELTTRLRSSGFGSPDDWLRSVQANVVFAFFGYNESFGGQDNLENFSTELGNYIRHISSHSFDSESPARIVLFSPIAHEGLSDFNLSDGQENNRRLAKYTNEMERLARIHDVPFVDLFHPTLEIFQQSQEPLTINGVHLNEVGNRKVAEVICERLFDAKLSINPRALNNLRQAVLDKNFHWFNRYRTTDGYSIFGGRKELGESEWTPRNEEVMLRELEVLDVMTSNRDLRVWAIARGEDLDIDDSNTPNLLNIASNKPGPLESGTYPFLDGVEAIEKMTIAKGMDVNLFASEEMFPELVNPAQLAVDTRGRLWVAAWPSYPHWRPKDEMNDKLLILVDHDGDGVADECKTFADGLHNPTGFEFYNGGVYVAQAPDIWYLKDIDGDDRADVRTRVLGGIDSADTHHAVNSFVIGPGGGLYFQEGLFHRTQVETPYGPPIRLNDGGVFRYEPFTQRLDVYSAYTFPNPHGHVFTRWGQDIIHDGTGARPIFGPSFSGHMDYPAKHSQVPQIYDQRTRPCAGTAILSSSHFPLENRDTLLVCNVIGFQGILQYKLEEDGAGLKGTEIEPIVYSSDLNFRPSDLEVGDQGDLYFSDWQNPLIGHMQHNLRDSNRDHLHGRIYRVTCQDRALRESPSIEDESIGHLLSLLAHSDNDVRYRAKIELSDRDSADVVHALERWVPSLDPDDPDHQHHQLEALWVYQHHNRVNQKLLLRLLNSTDYRVRAAATRVLRRWRNRVDNVPQLLQELVHDEHPRVRMQAILVCSDMTSAKAAEIALEAARYPCGKFLEYTLQTAVRALAPYWKEAIAAEEPFCSENPAAVPYILEHVDPVQIYRSQKDNIQVLEALLSKKTIDVGIRGQALNRLANQRNVPPVELLLEFIEASDSSPSDLDSLPDLVAMLAQWDAAALKQYHQRLETIAGSAKSPLIRKGVMAALTRSHESCERAWQLSGNDHSKIYDVIASVSYIPELRIRRLFYDRLKEMVFSPPETSIPAQATHHSDHPHIAFVQFDAQSTRDAQINALEMQSPINMGYINDFKTPLPVGANCPVNTWQKTVLTVAVGDTYTFFLSSNDSSQLWIDGQEVIDSGDALSGVERTGSIYLTAGPHRVDLCYLTEIGPDSLELTWQSSAIDRQPIPLELLSAPEEFLSEAAIAAMGTITGQELQQLDDLTACVKNNRCQAAALVAIRNIPLKHWQPRHAISLVEVILERIESLQPGYRTSQAVVEEMDLTRGLAKMLPDDQGKSVLDQLDELAVQTLDLGTIPHQMAYDMEKLVVEVNRPVQLTFANTDNMPHNWVLAQPGSLAEVGLLSESTASQSEAANRKYVPRSDKILIASRLLQSNESQVIDFITPSEPGVYPFVCTYPGHWRRMFGALYVVDDLKAYQANPERYLVEHPLTIADELLEFNRPIRDWKIEDLRPSLEHLAEGARWERGERLFQFANCSACHNLNGKGTVFGPDLATLDPKRTPSELLEDIVNPSMRINEKYSSYTFVLDSGKSVSGTITEETDDEIRIVADPLASCDPIVISRDEIEEYFRSEVSAMPSGLLGRLTKREILQLLAYVVAGGDKNATIYNP